jgi:hypothetical protein
MKLVQYRDAGMHTYTYFYVNDKNVTISPFFNSDKEAEEWLKEQANKFDNWKASKDFA